MILVLNWPNCLRPIEGNKDIYICKGDYHFDHGPGRYKHEYVLLFGRLTQTCEDS